MRPSPLLLCILALSLPMHAATAVTVAQLEQFLNSSRAARLSDADMAERLSRVDLSEELTSKALTRIVAESLPGPEAVEQLELLAAVSIIQPPPAADIPSAPAPDEAKQKQIITSAREYAGRTLHVLPDLLAVREIRSFNNLPIDTANKHQKPRITMHFASEIRREIAVRNGKEVSSALAGHKGSDNGGLSSGLSSWGEFGAILSVIFHDGSDGSMHWTRWQSSDSGARLAVFAYEIPRSDSHYTIDFCCYRESLDDPTEHSFRDQPAYRGEIFIDPANGEIYRITVEAELAQSDPVSRSAIAVQYGHVMIGGRSYLCPVRSIAISELYNPDMQKNYGVGLERHVNEVAFTHYHKFGSTARILTGANGTEQH